VTPPRSMPWLPLAIAGAAIIAGVVTMVVVLGKRDPKPDTEPAVIVVERDRGSSTAKSIESPPVEPPPIDPPPVDKPPVDKPPPRQGGSAQSPAVPKTTDLDALTRTFARQSSAITACFKQHPNTNEQVSVRIQIDVHGAVKATEVLPASVGASALGDCIATVARKTSFGPQPKPASFRVPLVKNER
jgi:hypothetical protein